MDLLLTNSKNNFDESVVLESGLSDFHKLVSVLKSYFTKEDPQVIYYRDYKYFDNEMFSNELENELKKIGPLTLNYDIFKNVCMDAINKYASLKRILSMVIQAKTTNYIPVKESCPLITDN